MIQAVTPHGTYSQSWTPLIYPLLMLYRNSPAVSCTLAPALHHKPHGLISRGTLPVAVTSILPCQFPILLESSTAASHPFLQLHHQTAAHHLIRNWLSTPVRVRPKRALLVLPTSPAVTGRSTPDLRSSRPSATAATQCRLGAEMASGDGSRSQARPPRC